MENPKYTKAIKELDDCGITVMRVFGNSMTPIISSGSTLTFQKFDNYDIGDVVFCRVRSRYVDAHLITAKNKERGYLISNNHGHDNGWTHRIYGKVVNIE